MSLKDENLLNYKVRLGGTPKLVFNDYKKTGLYIPIGVNCTGKCWREQGLTSDICQNWDMNNVYETYTIKDILEIYDKNPFLEAFIMTGMEAFDNFEEMLNLIKVIRSYKNEEIVIFTGYNPNELKDEINILKKFKDIIIKFGRYERDLKPKKDEVGGVTLVTSNQFFKRIEDL